MPREEITYDTYENMLNKFDSSRCIARQFVSTYENTCRTGAPSSSPFDDSMTTESDNDLSDRSFQRLQRIPLFLGGTSVPSVSICASHVWSFLHFLYVGIRAVIFFLHANRKLPFVHYTGCHSTSYLNPLAMIIIPKCI